MSSRVRGAKPDRRAAIADAAIEVLAKVGSRGLTHRAVDDQLRLPDGSTSYYFRTREALLAAAAERLVAGDREDMELALGEASAAASLLERWLLPERRSRLIARFELFMTSSRRDETQLVATARARFIAAVTRVFKRAGLVEPRPAAIALIALMDGLLLNELLGTGLKRADRARAVEALLRGLVAAPSARKRKPATRRRPA